MIFSWTKMAAFFAALLLIAWLIYPNKYFQGLMHRRDSDQSVSVKLYREYLTRHPHSKSAMLALSAAYESQADPEAAAEVLESLYSHRRGDLDVGREYLNLLERSGHGPQAQDLRWRLFEDGRVASGVTHRELEELLYGFYQRALLAQDDAAVVRSLTALAEVGKDPESYLSALVRIHMARRNIPELVRLLSDRKRRQPADLYTRLSLIYVFQMTKDYAAALREIDSALIVHPDEDFLLGARATVYEAQGRLDLALPDLERLAARAPRETVWRHDLASAWLKTMTIEKAAASCRRLLDRFPGDDELRWLLIYAYSVHGMHEEAAALLEPVLARNPDDAEALDSLVFQYEKLGRKDRVRKALENFVSAHPDDFERRRRLALLLSEQGRLAEFAALARSLLKTRPDDKELWWSLIYGLEDAKRRTEAANALEGYLLSFPSDPEAVDELTETYLQLGQKAKAIALLKKHLATKSVPGAGRVRRPHAPH